MLPREVKINIKILKKEPMNTKKLEIVEDSRGEWRWRVQNGKTIHGTSHDSFSTKAEAEADARMAMTILFQNFFMDWSNRIANLSQ